MKSTVKCWTTSKSRISEGKAQSCPVAELPDLRVQLDLPSVSLICRYVSRYRLKPSTVVESRRFSGKVGHRAKHRVKIYTTVFQDVVTVPVPADICIAFLARLAWKRIPSPASSTPGNPGFWTKHQAKSPPLDPGRSSRIWTMSMKDGQPQQASPCALCTPNVQCRMPQPERAASRPSRASASSSQRGSCSCAVCKRGIKSEGT